MDFHWRQGKVLLHNGDMVLLEVSTGSEACLLHRAQYRKLLSMFSKDKTTLPSVDIFIKSAVFKSVVLEATYVVTDMLYKFMSVHSSYIIIHHTSRICQTSSWLHHTSSLTHYTSLQIHNPSFRSRCSVQAQRGENRRPARCMLGQRWLSVTERMTRQKNRGEQTVRRK